MGAEVALATIAGGTILKGIGDWKANSDQADEEKQNAAFLREQAQFAQAAGDRQAKIFEDDAEHFYKNQVGLFARNGVQVDATVLADTVRRTREGLAAINAETNANVRLALLKGRAADTRADRLSSFGNNFLQASGTAMAGAGSMLSARASYERGKL
jgi:hypothetical protein